MTRAPESGARVRLFRWVVVMTVVAGAYGATRLMGPSENVTAPPATPVHPAPSPPPPTEPQAPVSNPDAPLAGTSGSEEEAVEHGPLAEALHARIDGRLSEEEIAMLRRISERDLRALSHPYGRIRLMGELVEWLKRRYPNSWRTELERIVRTAFPDEADDLLRLGDARESFEAYVNEHEAYLRDLTVEERREHLWEQRRAFFGEDADVLFENVHRNEALGDALRELAESHEGTPQERFGDFMDTVREQYGEESQTFIDARRTELIGRFLDLPATQEDLAEQPADARYAALRQIREESGMEVEALDRWDELDRRRDARWETGEAYSERRAAITGDASLSEADRASALDALRLELFDEEMAAQLAQEESTGFFRFDRERVYGRN